MDKKNEIKERARELFMRFGFHKTNMDDIARAANIAKPTLYYYYKSKEDLFNEVVLEESERFLNNVMMKVLLCKKSERFMMESMKIWKYMRKNWNAWTII